MESPTRVSVPGKRWVVDIAFEKGFNIGEAKGDCIGRGPRSLTTRWQSNGRGGDKRREACRGWNTRFAILPTNVPFRVTLLPAAFGLPDAVNSPLRVARLLLLLNPSLTRQEFCWFLFNLEIGLSIFSFVGH